METALPPCPDGTIFALDIGTRSVTGIAARLVEGRLWVDACETLEHAKRSMVDGQIEDIGQVAAVAGLVKQKLEGTLGCTLTKVSVAAAGRALKTCRATAEVQLPPAEPISAQRAYELESAAVDAARLTLGTGDDDLRYYCVAYTVVRYHLDGYPFANVVGHCAGRAAVEVIATFLPTEVVGSLQRCMDMLDLEIDTFTLEPIAAMRAVIPQDIRLLNLALVDVGAGTSDIALSRDGAAAGFTMATTAGDEITEAIIKRYLVNFETAERIKLSLETQTELAYTDILGNARTTPAADILASIDTAVDLLAKDVADKLYECNGGPPAALFLAGGGGRTPGLAAKLAAKLMLDEDRVAPGSTHFSENVSTSGNTLDLDGPEYATPLGIALAAADQAAKGGAFVRINGRKVRLFAGHTPSVMDALLMSGYRYSDLMGRNGRPLAFTLNGERKTLRGGPYTVAEITLNGSPAGLTSPVVNGDALEIVPAASGADARATVADAAKMAAGAAGAAGFTARLNGAAVRPEHEIAEFDNVEITWVQADETVSAQSGAVPDAAAKDEPLADPVSADAPADVPDLPEAPPADEPPPGPAAPGAPGAPDTPDASDATAQDGPPPAPQAQPVPGGGLRVTLNGRVLVLPPKIGGEHHCIADLLPLVDIDPDAPGARVSVFRNGGPSGYGDGLQNGDSVEVAPKNTAAPGE